MNPGGNGLLTTLGFTPCTVVRNPHIQTILANGPFSARPVVPLRRERLDLPDGDFLDLDWLDAPASSPDSPLIIVLHGLTGSVESRYAMDLFHRVREQGWRAVLMNFRGCSGEPNRLTRTYHAGDTGDFEFVLGRLAQDERIGGPIFAVGYSLGGNVLLKHLGTAQNQSPLTAAIAVSVPFDLEIAARSLGSGLSRLYQINLLQQLRKSIAAKHRPDDCPFEWERAMRSRDFFEFDDIVTAPIHGFDGVLDYYRKSSSRQFLGDIAVPTLVIHAEDDPFIDRSAIPRKRETSAAVTLEISRHGGHVGFLQGYPRRIRNRWLPARITGHLADLLSAGAGP